MFSTSSYLHHFYFRQISHLLAVIFVAMLLSACGGAGSDSGDQDSITGRFEGPGSSNLTSSDGFAGEEEISVLGSGVKGPLTDSAVVAYVLDMDRPDLKGRIVGRGSTDSLAQLQMRIRKRHLSKGPFLLEYRGGFELNGSTPIIDRLYTVVTEERIRSKLPVYATPLSSLVVNLAQVSLTANASKEDFAVALNAAESTVKQAFWLGNQAELDVFETSPVLTRTESPELTFMLRRASELFAASVSVISDELASAGVPYEGAAIVEFLAEDLNDGVIDGFNGSLVVSELAAIENLAAILTVDPDLLMIPGTDSEIAELDTLLLEEAVVLQNIVSSQTEEELVEAAYDDTTQVRFNNDFVDNPDSNSGDESSTDIGSISSSLILELTSESIDPVWVMGTEQLVEMRVSDSYIDQIDCYLDVKDGKQAILGTSSELWSPYQFKLSKVGSVPAGDYSMDIRCYNKGDSAVVLASTYTSLTVVDDPADTDTTNTIPTDTNTTDTAITDTSTVGSSTTDTTPTDGAGTIDSSLMIELTSESMDPIWTIGTELLVEMRVTDSYIDLIDCYLDVVDGDNAILGTSPELWSPYQFKLSKVGNVPAGDYNMDIRCYNKGDTSVVLASINSSLMVIDDIIDINTTDTTTIDTSVTDSTTDDSGADGSSLTLELTSSSIDPTWTIGTELLVEMRVTDSYIDQIDCYLDVVDGDNAILGASPELWSPYQFKLSKVGNVPAGDYSMDIRCYNKGDTSVVLASASTSLTVIDDTSGTTTITDTGTTDTSTVDSGGTALVTADVEFSWVWPTTREDGTALNAEDIDSFEVYYYRTGQAGVRVNVDAKDSGNALVNKYLVQNLEVGSYEFAVAAVDAQGNVSAFTIPVSVTVE